MKLGGENITCSNNKLNDRLKTPGVLIGVVFLLNNVKQTMNSVKKNLQKLDEELQIACNSMKWI